MNPFPMNDAMKISQKLNSGEKFTVSEFAEEGQDAAPVATGPLSKRLGEKKWKIKMAAFEELGVLLE